MIHRRVRKNKSSEAREVELEELTSAERALFDASFEYVDSRREHLGPVVSGSAAVNLLDAAINYAKMFKKCGLSRKGCR